MTSVTTLYDDSPFPCFPDGTGEEECQRVPLQADYSAVAH